MNIPDIVVKIFQDLGFSDFKNMLTGNFEAREYCVQYRETDFNFVSRLMEEEGIFYFFEHTRVVSLRWSSSRSTRPTVAWLTWTF